MSMRSTFLLLTMIVAGAPVLIATADAGALSAWRSSLPLANAGPVAGPALLAWAMLGLRLTRR
jgi:hypothetical protein